MKLYVFPTHTTKERVSGVDFARIIQPMKHLKKDKDIKIKIYDPFEKVMSTWDKVAKKYDGVYFNYTVDAWSFAAMGSMMRKHGKKIIMDIDDDLWNILPDNPAYGVFGRETEGINNITSIANEVDYITTTNDHLRNSILHNTTKDINHVKILPNKIDLKLYKYKHKPTQSYNIRLVHFGSTTHFTSLLNEQFNKAIHKLMQEYPNLTFTTIGSFIPEMKNKWGARYENKFGDIDVLKWIDKMSTLLNDADIVVTPLENNLYNRSKSSIKFLEVSSMRMVGCWQKIRQYKEVVRDGENGFLCETSKDWYRNIKKLIKSKKFRTKLGQQAYKDVKENHTIQDYIPTYKEFFTKVLTE